MDRLATALSRSKALIDDGCALGAEAEVARRQSVRLRREAMELRFHHRQLSRRTATAAAEAREALERSRRRDRTIPSPWSPLRFHPIDGELDHVLVRVK